jgi:signal transduction histidine kinase
MGNLSIILRRIRGIKPGRHWLVMGFLGLLSILLEYAESSQLGIPLINTEFLTEALIHGLTIPLLGGILLEYYEFNKQDKERAERQLSSQETLTIQLGNAQDWEQLAKIIAQFPSLVGPIIGSAFYAFNQPHNQFEREAVWGFEDYQLPEAVISQQRLASIRSTNEGTPKPERVRLANKNYSGASANEVERYCLQLFHANRLVGLLLFSLPCGLTLSENQLSFLASITPEMGLAIDESMSKKQSYLRDQAIEEERQRLAFNLHDTLGQDLGYIYQRLDALSRGFALIKVGELLEDLQHMKKVAGEAYELVRGTILELNPVSTREFILSLEDYAKAIGERAGFEVEFKAKGPQPVIPTLIQNQTFFIFREILANIEKHADATRVQVRLCCAEDSLHLEVEDNGRGFNLQQVNPYGHFGLGIIKERAKQIHGEIKLHSAPDSSTLVTLRAPFNQPVEIEPITETIHDLSGLSD